MRIPIVGPYGKNRFQAWNASECVNMYPSTSDTGSQASSSVALHSCPGLTLLSTVAAGECRKLFQTNELLYGVFGDKFYAITFEAGPESPTFTLKGTLGSSEGAVAMDANVNQIMIVDGTSGYIYNLTTEAFTTITDADFTAYEGPVSVVQIDGYFFVSFEAQNVIFQSDLNDGLSWDALNFTNATNQNGPIVTLAAVNGELWALKTKSTEVYYNAANATGFSFSPRQSAAIFRGCLARESVTRFQETIAWLDDRRFIVAANGYTVQVLSTQAVNADVQNFSAVTDAIFFSQFYDGREWLCCGFPLANKTFVFDVSTSMWHTRESYRGPTSPRRYIGNYYIYFNNRSYLTSYFDGGFYLYDETNGYDDDNPIIKTRVTPTITNENKMMSISKLELLITGGQGLVTGQGSDPMISLYVSKDGGRTWGQARDRSIGAIGEYGTRVFWTRLGMSRKWTFKFVVSDPIQFSIMDGFIEVEKPLDG